MSGWKTQKQFGDEQARVRRRGKRVEVLWGGRNGNRGDDGHGHLVSNDGVNASYLAEPGLSRSQRKASPAVIDDRDWFGGGDF